MNRRNAIKNLSLATGGLISLPFWMTACHMSDKDSHFSSFSPLEQAALAAVADTIIPAGPSIGALSVGVDKFLQKVLDDCYEPAVVGNVKKQLAAIDVQAKAAHGQLFAACNARQRQAFVLNGLNSANKEEKDAYSLLKSETIRGFNTSQQVMEGYLHYKVAPGHYYGGVTIKS